MESFTVQHPVVDLCFRVLRGHATNSTRSQSRYVLLVNFDGVDISARYGGVLDSFLEPGCELRVASNSAVELHSVNGSSNWRLNDKPTWHAEVIASPFTTNLPPKHLCLLVTRSNVNNEELFAAHIPIGRVPRAHPNVASYEVYLKPPDPLRPARRRYNGVVRWSAREHYQWPKWSTDDDSEYDEDCDPGVDTTQAWQAFHS